MEKVSKATASDVQASFRELAKTATQLNTVSDAIGKYVGEVETGLKTINLGVAAWVTFYKGTASDGLYTYYRDVGFEKIGKYWCIGIRHYAEAEWADEWTDFEQWAFNDAPRQSRRDAIDHLPELIQRLNREAGKVAKSLADKLPMACSIASDVTAIVNAQTSAGTVKLK